MAAGTIVRVPLPDVFFWFLKHFFLDFHVSELVGVEYLTTVQTFDVFDVLFTRYHADFWVFAGGVHLGDLSVQPILLGKIVPAGFSLSNLFLCIPLRFTNLTEIHLRGTTCEAPLRDAADLGSG